MPRSGPNGTYTLPGAQATQQPGTPIPSAVNNQGYSDIEQTFNTVQPIAYGGTNASSAANARVNLDVPSNADLSNVSGRINSPSNLSFSVTVASNALTVSVKGHDGSNPAASNAVYVPFRSATANSGDVDVILLTSTTSFVISSGSTLGTTNAVPAQLIIVGFNDAGTFRLGVINPVALNNPILDGIASSSAEGGAGGADSSGIFYTATAVSDMPYTVLGSINITEAVAGTWATAPTSVHTRGDAQNAIRALPFTKEYESAEQTITSAGGLSLTHGLGVIPKLMSFDLICKTAEFGYSVGEIVEWGTVQWTNATSASRGFSARKTSTSIVVRYGDNAGTSFVIQVAGTGEAQAITSTNWRLIVKAWA